jgi:hypothetical protein
MTGRFRLLTRMWPLLLLTCCLPGLGQASKIFDRIQEASTLSLPGDGEAQPQILPVSSLQAPPPLQGFYSLATGVPQIGGSQNAPPHTVRGTVVNSVTGEPIARALVQLGGDLATLTDHEGRFEFTGVTQSGIPPWAMKPGYFQARSWGPIGFNFNAAASSAGGSDDEPIVVKLVPEVIVSGTVTGQEGEPLSGIPVHLKMLNISDGISRWTERERTTTNSLGQYRFYDLEAGKYAVATGFHTEGLADADSSVAYVPARFPAKAETLDASAMALSAGDHREVNLSPAVEKLYPIAGVVSGYGESRIVVFRAETPDDEEITSSSRFSARTGGFHMMLPGCACVLTATAFQQPQVLQGKVSLTVPLGEQKLVAIALEPPATIPVEIEEQAVNQPAEVGTMQASGATVNLINADPNGSFAPLFAAPIRHGDGFEVPTGAGVRQIEGVAPGHYRLMYSAQAPWYVSSAMCGGVDLTHEELAVAGGAAGCSIRVVFRNDSGSLHVSVRASGPDGDVNGPGNSTLSPTSSVERTFVYAVPVGDAVRHVVAVGRSGADFAVDGIAPGRYVVLALDHPQELAYRDAEALRRYESLGQDVAVSANGKADAEVSVVHGEL